MNTLPENDLTALDELFHSVGTYKLSKDFKELLEFMKRFPKIAPYNAMLLHIQKPGSKYVATAKQWKKNFNRTIKPNAHPLVILQVFGPVAFVFEINDTEGGDFHEELYNPFYTQGNISGLYFQTLVSNMQYKYPLTYYEADHGTSSAGSIRKYAKGAHIFYEIGVNKNLSREGKFATIAHELGHLFCGHLGTPDKKLWPDSSAKGHEAEEFEAESVAWLVCERANIKNPSAAYLSGYMDKNGQIPQISLENVLKAAGKVESLAFEKRRRMKVAKEKPYWNILK
ncbi:MAG: ImmA/IrrE family metallo-endopeptidase [Desulfovibrio sp.]|jgi:hypothetical protein|nr:ImmA/IrrE family metallo-endopeptidase [Desulfovibrio sp.]